MKIKNIDLINAKWLLDNYATKRFPQKLSYAIMKTTLGIKDDVECYNKLLKNIIDSYNDYIIKDENDMPVYDKNTGIPMVDDEHKKAYIDEINELLDMEVEVNIHPIDISIFNYEDGDKYDVLSPREIMQLQSVLCKKE